MVDFVCEREFLSAAQPTDHGKESVVILLLVGGDHFSFSHVSFLGCETEILCFKRGVKRKNFVSKGM